MNELIMYSIVTVFGLVFSGAGVFLLMHIKREQARCSVEATGRVVEYTSRRKIGDGTYYYPIIEYSVQGELVQGQPLHGSTRKIYEIGDVVNLHYNPDKSTEMILHARKSLMLFAWLYIVSGVLVPIITIFLYQFFIV